MPQVDPSPTTGILPTDGVARTFTQNRAVKCFILTRPEMDYLSILNGASTCCVGFATTFFGVAIGIRTAVAFCDPLHIPAEGVILAGPGFWTAIFLGIAFAVGAIASYLTARNTKKDIQTENENAN